MRIGFASDFHIDADAANLDVTNQAITILEREQPDLILLGGDFFDKGKRVAVEPLWPRIPKIAPTFAVFGNHDHNAGTAAAEEIACGIERAGMHMLVNSSRTIQVPGGAIDIIGVDDSYSDLDDFDRAKREVDHTTNPKVLLSHSGMIADTLAAGEVDLILSGHTHGGQVRFSPSKYTTPIDAFWWLDRIKKQRLSHYRQGFFWKSGALFYVSNGLGTTSVRMRLMAPPEVLIFRIFRGHGREHLPCDEGERYVLADESVRQRSSR